MPTYAFAYLRRSPGMSRKVVHHAVQQVITFTEQHGFALAGVHYESRIGRRARVWQHLIGDCRNEAITHIIVPSLGHFDASPEAAAFMRDELAQAIRGSVWVADTDLPPSAVRPGA